MALNAAGYTASGAGAAATNGDYRPATGANATVNGVTQFTNGTYFLAYNPSGQHGPVPEWGVYQGPYTGQAALYFCTAGASASNVPSTGWNAQNGAIPAPTWTAIIAAAPAPPRNLTTVVVY